jgi:hypothetical protein
MNTNCYYMGNVERDFNGRRGRQDPITMRSLHREVHSYMVDNENINNAQEEILQSLNMFHKQVKKDFRTKKESSARKVTASKSHSRRDDHENDRK